MNKNDHNLEGDRGVNVNNFVDGMKDAPAFDPIKARKLYEAEHPSAEPDTERARAMAEAGDIARVIESKAKKEPIEAIKNKENGTKFMNKYRLYADAGKLADEREEFAGRKYDLEKNRKEQNNHE